MTEQEWLDCRDAAAMLDYLQKQGLDRRYRLFAFACVRRLWHLFDDDRPRRVVEVGERHADGGAGEREVRAAWLAARRFARSQERLRRLESAYAAGAADTAACLPAPPFPEQMAHACASISCGMTVSCLARVWEPPTHPDDIERSEQTQAAERGVQAALLRDVFGNPFRAPPAADPAWLSWKHGTVCHLARATYDDRDLPAGTLRRDRLALLADALEDAGCAEAGIVGHLRSPGPHVRGCWALDLVLGEG